MKTGLTLWLWVSTTYVVGRLASNFLASGVWGITGETATHMVLVPLAQLGALALLVRLRRDRT